MTTPQIILNNVSFHLEQSPVRFDHVNLSFGQMKYGLIGRNGVGKTTFLKLLLGELIPDNGSIERTGNIMYVPQLHNIVKQDATIADVLGVHHILDALNRIHHGSVDEKDYEIVADFWDIQHQVDTALSAVNFECNDLDNLFHHLSGGQKTKLLIAKTLIFKSNFLLLDEPTNNLDYISREILYKYIQNTEKGVVVISHDRKLLNQCDCILEITSKGFYVYGGNYEFYKVQKQIKQNALQSELISKTEALIKTKKSIQNRMEKHNQGESRGNKKRYEQIKAKGCYNKIEIKSKKGKSENTNRRIRAQASRKLESVNEELISTKNKIEITEPINICLDKTKIPNRKLVLKIENCCFSYSYEKTIIENINLDLLGADRVAVIGPNGCGKSTLIQLIRGLLKPTSGKIFIGVGAVAYLDQQVSFLDNQLTIVDNFIKLNPTCARFDAYSALASFKFRNKDAEKRVSDLSGGEKMRAGLAIILMSFTPPQLIILDEPTNHLDLDAIESLEHALRDYQGAILAVSHDQQFLENIGIDREVSLSIN